MKIQWGEINLNFIAIFIQASDNHWSLKVLVQQVEIKASVVLDVLEEMVVVGVQLKADWLLSRQIICQMFCFK